MYNFSASLNSHLRLKNHFVHMRSDDGTVSRMVVVHRFECNFESHLSLN